jgi:hypothetical protein
VAVPEDNIGKIFTSLFKYFNPRTGSNEAKRRPVLVIGCEENYSSPMKIDYEILPISKMGKRRPDPTYDVFLQGEFRKNLGLTIDSYIRSNKTTWHNVKHINTESPVGDLKNKDLQLFLKILELNEQWVHNRNRRYL